MARSAPIRWSNILAFSFVAAIATTMQGCVRRTIAITSTPADALVYVNDREVGRTPCEVDFLFYGEYDVRLKRDGYESIVGSGTASAPFWDFIGADLLVEVAPVNLESRVKWHFDLIPADNNHNDLLARAKQMREASGGHVDVADGGQPPQSVPDPADSIVTPPKEEQGASVPKGSSAVPVPPTELPQDVPGIAPLPTLPVPELR